MPRNPLDVLAQQIVAMTAMDDWEIADLEQMVRRAAPFTSLTRPVLEAVLDMLAGRYPSEEFAGLRPRLVWDRTTGMLHGRPGGQRLAVTNGGTIPDRGLFGVFLAARSGDRSGGTPAGSASWTRRWSTSPGSATCSCSARAPGGSRTSPPTRCSSRPRRGSRASCRSGTATRPGARPSSAARSARTAASSARPSRGGRHRAAARRRPGRAGRGEPAQLPGRAAGGDRLPARRPDAGAGAVPRRAGRLAAGPAQPVRRAGARAVGAGHRGPAARALPRHGRAGACTPTTAS